MKIPAAILLLAAVAALAAPARADEGYRDLSATIPVRPGQPIYLDLPLGEFEVGAAEGPEARLEITAACRWRQSACEKLLEELRIESRSSQRRLTARLGGAESLSRARLEIDGSIRLPASSPWRLDLDVGELSIEGPERDVEVELGVGRVNLRISRQRVRSVELDAGVGESELLGADERIEGRRSLLVGSEVHWDGGKGEARISIEVGVGEITVWLE